MFLFGTKLRFQLSDAVLFSGYPIGVPEPTFAMTNPDIYSIEFCAKPLTLEGRSLTQAAGT